MSDDTPPETFANFKNSFSYGSRTDLNFKFLRGLSSEDAAQFFQDLLWKLGDSFNDGQFDQIVEHIYQWQIQAYSGAGQWTYTEGPFTPLQKTLAESRLGLITSSGHFVEGNDPEPFGVKGMTQEEAIKRISEFTKAKPELSSIPSNTPQKKLQVRHGGYDIRAAQIDANVTIPLDILRALEQKGYIGELASNAYSFVGACSQIRLNKHAGPQWVKLLQQQAIDVVLLVPV